MPEGFVNTINPSTIRPFNESIPVGLVTEVPEGKPSPEFVNSQLLINKFCPHTERDGERHKRFAGLSGTLCITKKEGNSERYSQNKEILNSGNSCEPQRLMFQNDISKDEPFTHSTFHPFNKTSPSPACSTHPRGVLVERFTPHSSPFTSRKAAFTLAEVLITLGIIGVVAAMTLPALIQKNNNRVVETRLQKFYSTINQAILMTEKDYGYKTYWYEDLKGAELDEDGNIIEGSSEAEKWFNKYLKPYLKVTRTDTLSDGSLIVYFADGSALRPAAGYTRDWYFYPGDPNKCIARYGVYHKNSAGICMFAFNFYPSGLSESWRYHYKKGMEPYKAGWDGDIKKLYEGSTYSCKTGNRLYCTAIIQENGWKIPDDYPYKVSY